jgi:hypothetical protein
MQRAFAGTGHIVFWIVALGAILLSPLLAALIVSPETRYLVMSKRVGPSDWHENQVLKETGPLDILILGNSRMLTAIDHAALREDVHVPNGELTAPIHRERCFSEIFIRRDFGRGSSFGYFTA